VTTVAILIGVLAVAMVAHAIRSCLLMLYAWSQPERLKATAGPDRLTKPCVRFSVLLPARDEAAVIGDTIKTIWTAHYPRNRLELIVICQASDEATIEAATRALASLDSRQARLVVYRDEPFNKPHALNVGLASSSNDVVAVFDAEDDVHPDIFRVVSTIMTRERVGVVQAGVQLVNLSDHWFSALNCLEYYFHYKSRLPYFARSQVIPLGGNTVFFKRALLDEVGGWDVGCLTEDADIGIRLSANGHRIRAVYDPRRVTREETPHSVRSFVRQRTRWHQGFLQILGRGHWRRLPRRRQRLLALLTLSQPVLDAALLTIGILTPLALLYLKLPVLVALLTCLPLYAILLQMLTNVVAAVVFAREYGLRLPWWLLPQMVATYFVYQWLIAFSAVRATVRQALGRGEWEKTEHHGAHRAPSYAGQLAGVRPVLMAHQPKWDAADKRATEVAS
jgi:cellulose synthase/poly-beta-1,6-N-acetylglucosamine synthase-like glycosyltransferase